MDEEAAIATVYELLSGPNSIPVDLRMRRGLDRSKAEAVCEALQSLIERWADCRAIPRRVAYSLVNISGELDGAKQLYAEAEQDRIEDFADRVVELAYKLTDPDASDE